VEELVTWRDRFPDEITCIRCLEKKDATDLDRLFWCRACKDRARARAARWGWIVGAVAALLLTIYIWLVIRPSTLIIGGWVATVGACLWLTSRIGRETAYGVMRFRNRRAVEARPPVEMPDEDSEGTEEPRHWGGT